MSNEMFANLTGISGSGMMPLRSTETEEGMTREKATINRLHESLSISLSQRYS